MSSPSLVGLAAPLSRTDASGASAATPLNRRARIEKRPSLRHGISAPRTTLGAREEEAVEQAVEEL
eukprot:CAMPEP_0115101036 /NCGR_PEP_ID=MMETSP0227-20121206/32955_1 /TAXON_ID=89957 /ORGANISM="Polarella glacialis, Strain CCMP 1383" /LENGTH=65 /DNA_ID=CAMNT_0002496635 /DNA_START=372 /DNA_END=566 /DNA_ORIENTATION=-